MFKLLRENIRIAMGSIRTQLLRTVLTIFIIGIGIWALVGILTVVSALEHTITSDFASMGSNTFNMEQYNISDQIDGNNGKKQKVNPIISYPQAKAFKEKYTYPYTQTSVSFQAVTSAEVKYESKKTDPDIAVFGVDENYMPNTGNEISKGRNFSASDIRNNTYVCILGSDFEKGLFEGVENPIDKVISIRGSRFRVIGILKEKGSTFGNSQDLRVFIPIQVARSMYSQPNINYTVSVMVTYKEMLDRAVDNAVLTMRNIRKLTPTQTDNFGVSRSDDLINRILSITGYLNIAAWVIGIITIFGSSIALMNIMLVSVTERTREIGVRKALGANRSTIAIQFFVETLVIGQLGGLIGMIIGILSGYGVASLLNFSFAIPWGAMLAAVATTFVVAIVSGLYPAVKASRLDPIEALRYE
ncbi:ABC transporter permease [Flavobacterium silvaticum]|uniref:FtsX-like permease family protein n=1 Tax=Flavobacterium silvaticum TaxID=1852020 RepID=A0A972FL69_9FLAO|nr:ABC transporter permease [Flavobacterium silvaticum]NMH28074.1 FtsX-like permease family protein [Flavobacterium silvaticum]